MNIAPRANRMSTLAVAVLAALASSTAPAQMLDVAKLTVDAINADASAKRAIATAMQLPNPQNWTVASVKIPRLKASAIQWTAPKVQVVPITSSEILNCEETGTSRKVTLSKEVTDSISVGKSQTFSQSVEANVSADLFFGSAGVTSTTSFSMTSDRREENSQKISMIDEVTVNFDKKGGRISVLTASRTLGNQIPWTATFVPDDRDDIQVTMQDLSGEVCVHTLNKITKCYKAGTDVDYVGPELNDKIAAVEVKGPAAITLWEHWHYGGQSTSTAKTAPVMLGFGGAPWSSLKVYTTKSQTTGLPFSRLKTMLPQSVRSFTASGTVDIFDTRLDSKRIVNYPMTAAELQEACAVPPPAPGNANAVGTQSVRSSTNAGVAISAGGVRVRTLSDAEMAKRLANVKPAG